MKRLFFILPLLTTCSFAADIFVQDGGITIRQQYFGCDKIGNNKICRSTLVGPYNPPEVDATAPISHNIEPVVTTNNEPQPVLQHRVLFGFDKSNISESENKKLNKALPLLENKEINIVSFSDPLGSEEYNRKLIDNRNKSVSNALAKKGIKNVVSINGGEQNNPKCTSTKKTEQIQCYVEQRSTSIYTK